MQFDQGNIQNLLRLCRINCTEAEQVELLHNLEQMISYFEQLNEIDTEHVMPCNHVIENVYNIMREDDIGPMLDRDTFLNNAPAVTAHLIRVPRILVPPSKQN